MSYTKDDMKKLKVKTNEIFFFWTLRLQLTSRGLITILSLQYVLEKRVTSLVPAHPASLANSPVETLAALWIMFVEVLSQFTE